MMGYRLRSRAGFSMVGVMMAVGLIALMSLGVAGLMSSMNRETKALNARMNKIGLAQDLRILMAESSTCTRVFGGNVQPLSLGSGAVSNLSGNLAPSGQAPVIVGAGQELRQYGVRVKRLIAQNPVSAGTGVSGSRLYVAEVLLEVEELGPAAEARALKASSVGFSYFELPAAGGNDNIQRCYSLESQGDLLEVSCLKFGGIFNPTTRECDTLQGNCARLGGQWNATNRTCNTLPSNCQRMGGTYNASNDTCRVTPTPQESCTSVGGTYTAEGGCSIPDKGCPVYNGGDAYRPASPAGTVVGYGCGRYACLSGVWLPIPPECPTSTGEAGGNEE